jgi:DNA mismatch repair protein MutS
VHQGPRNRCGLAWLSVTQGVVFLAECAPDEVHGWISRVAPSELAYSASCTNAFEDRLKRLRSTSNALYLTARPEWQFDSALGQRKLLDALQAASLSSWSAQDLPLAHAASAALLGYAEHTQGRALTHIHNVQVQRNDALIDLPVTTRRNLELVQTLRGEDSPTLFSLLDTCMTGMGSRMLKSWLLEPQRNRTEAQHRLQSIGCAGGYATKNRAARATSTRARGLFGAYFRAFAASRRCHSLVGPRHRPRAVSAGARRRCDCRWL